MGKLQLRHSQTSKNTCVARVSGVRVKKHIKMLVKVEKVQTSLCNGDLEIISILYFKDIKKRFKLTVGRQLLNFWYKEDHIKLILELKLNGIPDTRFEKKAIIAQSYITVNMSVIQAVTSIPTVY